MKNSWRTITAGTGFCIFAGVPNKTLPSKSTAAQKLTDGHEITFNRFVPSTRRWRQAAAPPVGAAELITRSSEVAAQNEFVGHAIVGATLIASRCARVQAEALPKGLVEVSSVPSTFATQSDVDGHDTAESPPKSPLTTAWSSTEAPGPARTTCRVGTSRALTSPTPGADRGHVQ